MDLSTYALSKQYTDKKTFDEINILPVYRNKFDANLGEIMRFNSLDKSYSGVGRGLDDSLLFEKNPTVRLSSDNAVDAYVYYDIGAVTDLSNNDFVDLYLHIDDIDSLNLMQIDLMTGSNLLNRFSYFRLANDLKVVKQNGWRFVRIPKRKFDLAAGSPNWSQIRYFRILVRSISGKKVKINLGKLDSGKIKKGAVSFYFDDATEDQYRNAFPIMENYGFRGTIAVPTNKVGRAGYVTWSQLREMHNAGWLIVSHGHNEKSLANLPESEIRYEISTAARILFEKGFHFGSKCIVAPQGSWSDTVDQVARDYLVCCRNYNYGSADRVTPSMEFPQSHSRYQKYLSPYDTDSVATMKGWIDNVVERKEEFSFAWHIIETPTPPNYQWSTTIEDFEAVIAYARQKVDEDVLDVVTWQDTMIQSLTPTMIDDTGKQYIVSKNGKPSVLTLPI